MDCSPPGSCVQEIFQARILEWVAISFSRESSQPRDQTQVSCTAGRFFTNWATREVLEEKKSKRKKSKRITYIITYISASLTMLNPLTVWLTVQCGKFLERWEYQTTFFWETCMQVKKQQLELDMEQGTGSKSGKEYVKAVYCHPAYLTWRRHWHPTPVLLPGKSRGVAKSRTQLSDWHFHFLLSISLTTLKPLTVCITTNCREFLKRWEYQLTLPVS